MANNGQMRFGVQWDVQKLNLHSAEQELKRLSELTKMDIKFNVPDAEFNKFTQNARELSSIFGQSYNFKLNTVDFAKLDQLLQTSNINITSFMQQAEQLGGSASIGAQRLNAELIKTNKNLQQTTGWTKKIVDTFSNTLRWTLTSTAINSVTGSIQKAYGFAKQLDTSLTNIRIVTGKSAEDMEQFAIAANKAAKELGASTKSYTDAALIYYQQGLSEKEVMARANVTVKAANITGQSAKTVSEQLTAVWNGYKVGAQEAELYIDKLSAVAATTAADLEELSVGMSKVASAANVMGVDIDQLNAQLATIVSTTREAPESIGTALKTVYARMSDIEAGLDSEVTLGEYTQQMKELGVNVLDADKNLRNMGDVVEEIGNNWGSLNRNQQIALAQTIAGTRQYSRMMALFDNWDMYRQAKGTSASSKGTLEAQNEIYLDSFDAKLKKLETSAERLYNTLIDNDAMKTLIDFLSGVVDLSGTFLKSMGGGVSLIAALSGAVLQGDGANKIGELVSKTQANRQNEREIRQAESERNKFLKQAALTAEDEQARKRAEANLLEMKTRMRLTKDEQLARDARVQDEINAQVEIQQIEAETAKIQKQADEKRNKVIANRTAELKKQLELANKASKDSAETAEQLKKTSEVFHRQARTEDNKAYKESVKFTFNPGAKSGGPYINAPDAQAALDKTRIQFEQEKRALLLMQKQLAKPGTNVLSEDFAKNAQARFSWLQEHREQLDLTEEQWTTLTRQQEQYTRALEQGDATKARRAISGFVGEAKGQSGAQGVVDKAIDENTQAREFLSEFTDLDKLNAAIEESKNKIAELKQQIADLTAGGIDALTAEEQELLQKLEAQKAEASKDMSTQVAAKEEQIKQSKRQTLLENQRAAMKGLAEETTKTVGGLLSMITAWQSFQSLGRLWKDEDATTGEKILQTVFSLSTALPATIKGLHSTFNGLSQIVKSIKDVKAASQALEDVGETTANVLKTKAEQGLADAVRDTADASREKAAAQRAEAGTTAEATGANIIKKATEGGDKAPDMPDVGKGAEVTGKTAGKKGLGKFDKTLGKTGTLAIVLTTIIAATAATVAIVSGLQDALKRKAKEAEKAAERQKSIYEDAKAQWESLESSLDSIDSMSGGLKDLTEGTAEWKMQIQSINEEVLELMKLYPELYSEVSRDANGMLSISSKGQELVKEKQLAATNKAKAASLVADQNAADAQMDALAAEWAESKTGTQDLGAELASITGVMALGGAIGGILGPLGSIAGAAIGGVVGIAASTIGAIAAVNERDKAKDELLQDDGVKKAMQAAATSGVDIFNSEQALASALGTTTDRLTDLQKELVANSAETKRLTEAYLATQAQKYQNAYEMGSTLSGAEGWSEAETVLRGQAALTRAKELAKTGEKDWKEVRRKYRGGNDADEAFFEEYARLAGIAYTDYNSDGANKITYEVNGKSTTVTMKDLYKDYARLQQTEKARSEGGSSANNAVQALEKLGGSTALWDAVVAAGMEELGSAAFNDLTRTQVKELEEQLKNLDSRDIAALASAMQLENAAALETILEEGFALQEAGRGVLGATLGDQAAAARFAKAEEGLDLSLNSAKQLALDYENLFSTFGSTFADQYLNIFTGIKDVSQSRDLINAIQSVGWESLGAEKIPEELERILHDEGIVLDAASASNLAHLIGINVGKMTSLEELQKKAVSARTLKSSVQSGAPISQEEYAALDPALKAFFAVLEDGTAALTIGTEEFMQKVDAQYAEIIDRNLEAQQARVDQLKAQIVDGMSASERESIESQIRAQEAQLKDYYLQKMRSYEAEEEWLEYAATTNAAAYITEEIQKNYFEATKRLKALESLEKNLNKRQQQADALLGLSELTRSLADDTDTYTLSVAYLQDYELYLGNIKNIQSDINTLSSLGLDAEEEARRKLELQTELASEMLNLKTAMEEVERLQVQHQTDITNNYSEQVGYLSEMNDLADKQASLYQLWYGSTYDTLGIEKEQLKNLSAIAKLRYNDWQNQKARYEQAVANGEDPTEFMQLVATTGAAAADSIQTLWEAAQKVFFSQTEAGLNAVFAGGFDNAADEWKWFSDLDNKFLSSIDAAYKKEDLRLKYQREIAGQAVTAQADLNTALEEELGLLARKDKLTQKDLDRAQARLDLELARIALDEAQRNKTSVQLVRNSDGSYSYDYVVDNSDVLAKQQQVNSAEQNLFATSKESVKDTWSNVYDLIQTFRNRVQENIAEGRDSSADKVLQSYLDALRKYLGDDGALRLSLSTLAADAERLGLDASVEMPWMNQELLDAILSGDLITALESMGSLNANQYTDFLNSLGIDQNAVSSLLSGTNAANSSLLNLTAQELQTISAQKDIGASVDELRSKYENLSKTVRTTTAELAASIALAQDLKSPAEVSAFVSAIMQTSASYDTGGYTGAWGGDGKMAVLHEKELVLNKTDTRNILSAVDMVRTLRNLTTQRLNDLSVLTHGGGYHGFSGGTPTIEQTVQINAEFPNATDHNEIREALESLSNLAVQHAYERKL